MTHDFDHLENTPLSPDELHYATRESQAAPYRMQTLGAIFSWRYYPAFPVKDIVHSIKQQDIEQGGAAWNPNAWLMDEVINSDDDGYRVSQLDSLDEKGVLDPVVVMFDARGFDIGDGWHRIAWSFINDVDTIPAFVGVSPEDLTASWYRPIK